MHQMRNHSMDAAYAHPALLDSYQNIQTLTSVKVPALPSSIAQNYTSLIEAEKAKYRLPSTMTSVDIEGAHPTLRVKASNRPHFTNRTDDIEGAKPRHKIADLRKNANRVNPNLLVNPIAPMYSDTTNMASPKRSDLQPEPFHEFSFEEQQKRLFGGTGKREKIVPNRSLIAADINAGNIPLSPVRNPDMWRYGQQLIHPGQKDLKKEGYYSERGLQPAALSYDVRQFKEARKSHQPANEVLNSVEGIHLHKRSLEEPVHGISTQLMAERQNNLGNLQKHINQNRTKRSPFAVQAQLNPYTPYEDSHKQATLEMAKQYPAAGQRRIAGAGQNIVSGSNGTAKFHQNVADFFDASRPSTGQVASHPERFQPPSQIKQQLDKEKKYEQRQKYDRNALFGGRPNNHYGPGDTLDRELARNNELRKNFELFHNGQANPKTQFKEDVQNFYDMKAPDPTPRSYSDQNHRAQLMMARANERMIDNRAKGESRSKRVARIQADSNFQRAYSEFFDKSDPAPSSSQSRKQTKEIYDAYQSGAVPMIGQQDVNFDHSKRAFYDNKTPTDSRMMRKLSVPGQKRGNQIDYEQNVYGGPSYSYMKNKATFFGEESTGLPKSNQINFNRAKSAFFGVDSSPAYKGKDHGGRYDPYRDSNIGNVRHISPTPGLTQEQRRVHKPRGGHGAFALF